MQLSPYWLYAPCILAMTPLGCPSFSLPSSNSFVLMVVKTLACTIPPLDCRGPFYLQERQHGRTTVHLPRFCAYPPKLNLTQRPFGSRTCPLDDIFACISAESFRSAYLSASYCNFQYLQIWLSHLFQRSMWLRGELAGCCGRYVPCAFLDFGLPRSCIFAMSCAHCKVRQTGD